jgi:hypothetical protein
MGARTDILFDETGDLAVDGGDFLLGPSSDQHVQDILHANPGEYKEWPMIGASIIQAMNGSLDGELRNKCRQNLEADGYRLTQLELDEEAMEEAQNDLILLIDYEEK